MGYIETSEDMSYVPNEVGLITIWDILKPLRLDLRPQIL